MTAARSISVTQRAAALNDASHFGRALVDSAESPPLSYLAGAPGASPALRRRSVALDGAGGAPTTTKNMHHPKTSIAVATSRARATAPRARTAA